jgi:TetR/AcrR family transcriptional regulator, regulator of biofilm formation and stress response
LITDGRRRKGEQRRQLLLDATMRVIEREGIAAVSQRVVAREAGVPPSAVTYYFPAVDDLLVAALALCNDVYLQGLDACARDADPIAALARLIADGTGASRAYVAAEYELFLIAARRPELQPEAVRWAAAVDAFLTPYAEDPIARAGVAAAVDGLLLRCFVSADPPSVDEVHAVLARILDH